MNTSESNGTTHTTTMSSMTTAQQDAPQLQHRACASSPACMSSQPDAGQTQKHDALSGFVPR